MEIDENSVGDADPETMGDEKAVVEYTKKSVSAMGRSMSITR